MTSSLATPAFLANALRTAWSTGTGFTLDQQLQLTGGDIASGQSFQLHGTVSSGLLRGSTARFAYRLDQGQNASMYASMAKCFATDTAMEVTTNAVQVLGGAGYVRDYPLERYMRDVKVAQIFEGTNQIQRVVIARALLGRLR